MKKAGELYPLEVLEELWQEINIDIIGLLSKSKDKNAIVVILDQFTKRIRLKVTTMVVSLEKIAKIYWDEIWKLHRVLKQIFSNERLQFASKFIKDLTRALDTKRILLIAYHP